MRISETHQFVASAAKYVSDVMDAKAVSKFGKLTWVASGKVKPMIEVYPLVQVNEVRARLEAGQVRYRAVLTHA